MCEWLNRGAPGCHVEPEKISPDKEVLPIWLPYAFKR